jgi:hypothetical protein
VWEEYKGGRKRDDKGMGCGVGAVDLEFDLFGL